MWKYFTDVLDEEGKITHVRCIVSGCTVEPLKWCATIRGVPLMGVDGATMVPLEQHVGRAQAHLGMDAHMHARRSAERRYEVPPRVNPRRPPVCLPHRSHVIRQEGASASGTP